MTLTHADARHLLRRAGYGALPAEVTDLAGRSRSDAVDRVLRTAGGATQADVPVVSKSSSERRGLAHWWVEQMTTSPAPIVERITYFWHSHFACSSDRVRDQRLMRNQHWLFRGMGFGPFGPLLHAVSVQPAMLIDLDNASNVAGDEQENFARELLELYTIGNGQFTEDDVVSVARAWTGHGLTKDTSPVSYQFYSDRHDKHDKALFGITRKWDGPEVIDELVDGVKRNDTAWFLAIKLWREFGDPGWASGGVLNAIADALKADDLRLMAGIRALFLHDDFWAPERRFCMVKPPLSWIVELQRRTGLRLSASRLDQRCDTMGHRLFLPPSVGGWGHNTAWLSASALLGRARTARDLSFDVDDVGFFSGLADQSPDAATDRILFALGVPDASPGTRGVVRDWFEDAVEELNGSTLEREAFRMGALLPEVNLS